MADNSIPPSDRFARAVARVQAKRVADGLAPLSGVATVTPPPATGSKSPRARLNSIPDDRTLGNLISEALAALSRGITWARGAIVNLVV